MAFDINGARKAGYSDAEIADHLASSSKFDLAGARKAGYSDKEILQHLTPTEPAKPPEAPKGTGSTLLDGANAVGSGFMRGMTRLVGAPVDAIANVRDLGKAAIGAPYIAITGKEPPRWLQVGDRANDVGSGDNLIGAARKTAVGKALVDPANPDYEGGYLQNAGAALTAVNNPKTLLQGANQFVLGQAGAAAGKATADATGNPALAIAAGLAPGGAQNLLSGGVKRAVRGGEEGRQAMVQRMQDLKNAGVEEPTLGLASGNTKLGAAENLLQSTPGAVGIMSAARQKAVDGLANKAREAADTAAPVRGADIAGTAIQSDIKGGLKNRIQGKYQTLNDKVMNAIGPDTPVSVNGTIDTANLLTAPAPGAPSTSALLVQPRIKAIGAALSSDAGGAQPTSSPILSASGAPFQSTQPGGPAGIPFQTLKDLRTKIGKESSSNAIMGTPEQGEFKQLYGAMSGDMKDAARASDMAGGPVAAAGPAERALNRANNFYSAGMGRVDRVQPLVNKDAPEQTFTALLNSTKENNSTLQAVKKSVTPETRATVAGTVIDRLGRANPGNQNDLGDVFSQERFLTNWNTMTPKARDELFSGFKNSDQVKADVEAIAKASSMMRDSSKMYANPSGTGANLAARGLIGAVGGGGAAAAVGLMNPMVPIGAAAGLGGVNLLARGLTSPRITRAIAERNYLSPELQDAQIRSLIGAGRLSKEAQ